MSIKEILQPYRLFLSTFIATWLISGVSVAGNDLLTAAYPVTKAPQKIDSLISEQEFLKIPDASKPWVYYWWLKGNVDKKLITRDLEEMKKKGIGGFLLIDSRGYHDDSRTGNVPVPLEIKLEFMSTEWREMLKFTLQECDRLGLKVSINLANTGGSLRGPWDMGENRPKQLVWAEQTVPANQTTTISLNNPTDKKYFKTTRIVAVNLSASTPSSGRSETHTLNGPWNTVTASTVGTESVINVIDITDKVLNDKLVWNAPAGNWKLIRFGHHVIGDDGSVDILNKEAVTKYFNLIGAEILKDAGNLAGKTLTHFYNVSWEGSLPDWTEGFEQAFLKYRGYNMLDYLPLLAGMSTADSTKNARFLSDYYRTISDCFKDHCYGTIKKLTNSHGLKLHSESGGPWPYTRDGNGIPMFREADQYALWGANDTPQGEFWCNDNRAIPQSNIKYTAMAAHTYGSPLVAVEAFTHMATHWSKYPANLKPFADMNFLFGGNWFIWHTFTASPLHIAKPGYEYFAGTHLNPNVTWWDKAGSFLDYLGRCQYLLQKGHFVADVIAYVSDKNYVSWGTGAKWNQKSSLFLDKGYAYDMVNTDVLLNRLTFENGKFRLPDGMSYKLLVVDPLDNNISNQALAKILDFVKQGATVVLGDNKPVQARGLLGYPAIDRATVAQVKELWGETESRSPRTIGKGEIYAQTTMDAVLARKKILPDFEGPFSYLHRQSPGHEIYFVSGEGKAACTFRVKDMVPKIWDPVTGNVRAVLSYDNTDDGRTRVFIELPKNGAVFIVFTNRPAEPHFTSIAADVPEFAIMKNDAKNAQLVVWETGELKLDTQKGKTISASVKVSPPIDIQGPWDVTFNHEGGAEKVVFNNLSLWNEHASDKIKYFSGTAIYKKTIKLNEQQVKLPVRLQLGTLHDIGRVSMNGKPISIIWTNPWIVDLTGHLKTGNNTLEIEVTNCWPNRLIGDAGLPEHNRHTETNVRLVKDRGTENKQPYRAFSAKDPLFPSGLIGPVRIQFGTKQEITY
jgi:hypothetical protein